MAKTHTSWKVLPHDPIQKLNDRLWRVEGSLEGMPVRRVMTIARRADDTLVIHNGICLGDAEMAEIDAWGRVSTIVVPNSFHRLDAKVFHDRYPTARVLCPAGARKKVEDVVPVAGAYGDFTADAHVELIDLDGTKSREGAMLVHAGSGTTIVFNDAVFNMPHLSGFTGFVFRRITSSSGGPRVSRVMKWLAISDKRAFRAHLERLAGTPKLERIIVSHHEMIVDDPAATLRSVAAAL